MQHVEEQDQERARGHGAPRRGRLLAVGIAAVLVIVALATDGGGLRGFGGSAQPDVTIIPTGGGPGITTPLLSAAAEAGPVGATRQTLVDVAGAGSTRTKDITPVKGWSLAWAYDCSLPVSTPKGFTVTVQGLAGATPVRHTDGRGSGVETYAEGGPVYLEIDSRCAWSVKVLG